MGWTWRATPHCLTLVHRNRCATLTDSLIGSLIPGILLFVVVSNTPLLPRSFPFVALAC